VLRTNSDIDGSTVWMAGARATIASVMPVSTVIIGVDDVKQLEQNVQYAKEFTPLTDGQMLALQKKTEPIARQALFFRKWSAG